MVTSSRLLSSLAALVTALSTGDAAAFSEESGALVDGTAVSTHHYHLTRALAVCAGFTAEDAETIARFDAMTDVHDLGADSVCHGIAYSLPSASELACADDGGTQLAFPTKKFDPEAGCFTDRQGPGSEIFHFPSSAGALPSLRAWALGDAETLSGDGVFAFGHRGDTLYNADCYRTRWELVETGGVTAGSLAALGVYLHGLADSWSHRACIDGYDSDSPPWPTHTLVDRGTGCGFSTHLLDFGCPDGTRDAFIAQTIAAGRDVYDALREAAGRRLLPARAAYDGWLARQVEIYATSFANDAGAARADFANALAASCGSPLPACPPDLPTPGGEVCPTWPLEPGCSARAEDTGGVVPAPSSEAVGCAVSGGVAPPLASVGALLALLLLARRRAGHRS